MGADGTNKVRSMIHNSSLDFKVNNSNLGGDPNVGADKVLTLNYTKLNIGDFPGMGLPPTYRTPRYLRL